MKIMLQGTDALWALWLGFFRDNLAAFVSLLILMPLALFINWRLAILLIVLCVLFAVLTALVLRKTESMQQTVQTQHSDLAERASDALGNIALVQSFTRVESEVMALRSASEQLLAAQFPVLSWWAVVAVLTRAATTLTVLSIILLGTWLFQRGLISVGEIVTFMAFAGMVIGRLDQAVSFVNRLAMDSAKLREFFDVLDTIPAMHDRPDAVEPGRFTGGVEFKDVSFAYDGKRPAVAGLNFTALPGETVALVGATGAGKSTALALLHRAFDPQSGRSRSTAWMCGISNSPRSAAISASYFRRRFCSTARSRKICGSENLTRQTIKCARRRRGRRRSILLNTAPTDLKPKWESAGARCRAASANACRLRARC